MIREHPSKTSPKKQNESKNAVVRHTPRLGEVEEKDRERERKKERKEERKKKRKEERKKKRKEER